MRQFNLINMRGAAMIAAGLLILAGLYGGGRQFFKEERVEVEREEREAEVKCEMIYTDLKAALIDSRQEGKLVCGVDISGKKYLELTRGLSGMKELLILDASDNIIREVPDWIGEMDQLQALDLSHNRINTLPLSLGQLKGLKRLDLTGNPVPPDMVEEIRDRLPDTEVIF